MAYSVKEIYYTIQGEGAQAGRPAVFLRFAGCNLWSGREEDRSTAVCQFCDTDFIGTDGPGGGRFETALPLAKAALAKWPRDVDARPLVVCTGGEPLLQLDSPLTDALHAIDFEVAVETNGTMPVPPGVDWLCVSPKVGAELLVTQGQELKLVFPQLGLDPQTLESLAFNCFYLQPMDGPCRAENTQAALDYCLAHPKWRLSLQLHKVLGIA